MPIGPGIKILSRRIFIIDSINTRPVTYFLNFKELNNNI